MKAKKGNRILTITEAEKSFYLDEGYDIVEYNEETKQYEVVESATGGKTYSIAEYQAVVKERDELKVELATFKAESKPQKEEFNREVTKEKLTELGVEFRSNASNDALKKLLEEATKEDAEPIEVQSQE